ncbi:MAG: Gfo/Idh/MocA family oxidoreductase [Bacteroidota bacterium]|nr:Gfo/Idh/MocA family oxidoreductase [Bacteroidota bacterium]
MQTKGWGVIGASTIARQYMIRAINAQPDSRVVAILSGSEQRARTLADEFDVPRTYVDLDAFLGDPNLDVVYVSSTNERHKAETIAAARAGRHVLCEKPLALNLADAQAMIRACQEADVVMGTNHHLRNAATHRQLRKMLKGGAIGKPLAARVFHAVSLPENLQTWRINNPEAGGGVILDITVHDTDTLRFILGEEVCEVTAMQAAQGMGTGGVEDAVMGVMRFESGLLAQFHDGFTVGHAGTGLEIHGIHGSLIAEDVMTQRPVGRVYLQSDDERFEFTPPRREDLYTRAVRHFNRAVDGDGTPSATAEDGLRSLAVALAVREAARTGRCTKVQYG